MITGTGTSWPGSAAAVPSRVPVCRARSQVPRAPGSARGTLFSAREGREDARRRREDAVSRTCSQLTTVRRDVATVGRRGIEVLHGMLTGVPDPGPRPTTPVVVPRAGTAAPSTAVRVAS